MKKSVLISQYFTLDENMMFIIGSLIIVLSLFLTLMVVIPGKRKKKSIDTMSGLEFEEYVAKILKNNGYKIYLTKSSHDFGADIIVYNLGSKKLKMVIQLKRYSEKIPISAVQEVFAAMFYYDADISVVLTNNYFSNASITLADKIGVELWDRGVLLALKRGERLEKYLDEYL